MKIASIITLRCTSQLVLQKMDMENKEMQTVAQWNELRIEMFGKGYGQYIPQMDLEQQMWEQLGKDVYNQPKGRKGRGKGGKGPSESRWQ